MKRIITLAAGAMLLLPAAQAKKHVPARVQGVDYASTLPADRPQRASDWEWDPNPDAPAMSSTDFGFDDIQNWTGEGENRAALVIQWNDSREQYALVFGYRWDGLATGSDMIKAVVKNNPRLYTLMQYTNVSSPTDPNGGYTINGFGWDADNDGDISLVDTGNGNQVYTSEDGFFEHPRGYNPELGGSSDYDYDNWKAGDDGDFWGAGWYLSYWSYWVGEGEHPSSLSYSSWGASGRVLENGSWDGWNFSLNMLAGDWKELKSAPSLMPEGAKTEFHIGDLFYQLADYSKGTVRLVNPTKLTETESAAYRTFAGEPIVIPTTFTDPTDGTEGKVYTVTEIDADAFSEVTGITSVTIPATVTKIGARAFSYCSDLVSLTGADGCDLNRTLASIGEEAFLGCEAFTIPLFPTAMTALPARIYGFCKLSEELAIPAHVAEIGDEAFCGAELPETLRIPSTLKKIGTCGFYMDNLKSVISDSYYPAEVAEAGFSETTCAEGSLDVPTGFKDSYAAKAVWSDFANVAEHNLAVKVDDIFRLNGVTYTVTAVSDETEGVRTVEVRHANTDGATDNKTIEAANKTAYTGNVTIPATISLMGKEYKVASIESNAFRGASEMTSADIKAPVETIGEYAFYDCANLAAVTLPSSVRNIGAYAFSYTGIKGMTLPEGVSSVGERAFFQSRQLESINIPASLTVIPDNMFNYCTSLKSIDFGENVTEIGNNAMQNCTSLVSAKLPSTLTKISDYLFSKCSSMTAIDIPANVTEIGRGAFESCSALTVRIPAGITTIGNGAFQKVANETFEIPAAVTALPGNVFNGCANLREVTLAEGIQSIGSSAFFNCVALTTIRVAKSGTAETDPAQLPAREGVEQATGLVFPSTLTKIDSYAFQNCKGLTSVSLPESLTTIGSGAFKGCTSLTEATLPNSVKAPGTGLFEDCSALRTLTLGNATTKISQNLVRNCVALDRILVKGMEVTDETPAFNFPTTLTTVDNWAFGGCKAITALDIPEGVTTLSMSAFNGCSNLTTVNLPSTLKTLGSSVFANCNLSKLVIPASVSSLSSGIVQNNTNLTAVYICSEANPIRIYSAPFQISSGKHAPLVVPVGKSQAYSTANYWKNSEISEPEVETVTFSATESDSGDIDNAEMLVNGAITYTVALPAAFKAVNDAIVFAGEDSHHRISLSRIGQNGAGTLASDIDDDLFLDHEGKGSFSFGRPDDDTLYAVKVSGEYPGPNSYESAATQVKIRGVKAVGIDSITADELETADFYTPDGIRADRANLRPGVYVAVKNGRSFKVVIR